MIFDKCLFTDKEKIELLERSIMVNSYAYYELDENILSDYQYDTNTRQLLELRQSAPEAFEQSRYYSYFYDFVSGTGFDLLKRIRDDKELFWKVRTDALMALERMKR